MYHLKRFWPLTVVATALVAFAATASADVATSPTGTTYTGTIKASAEGHVVVDYPAGPIQCPSILEGTIVEHGSGKTVKVNLSNLTYANCTGGAHVTVVSAGTLSIHGVAGTYNGDVFSSGATVESTIPGLGTCRYVTVNTTLGTLTGGTTATIHLTGNLPFHSGSIFCGTGATAATGSYIINSPDSLFIDTT